MIYLTTGTNSVTVTLNEMTLSPNPFYTWELTRKGSFDTTVFYTPDISPYPEYWNKFEIVLGTVSGLTAGLLNISSGEYIYKVYEMIEPYQLGLTNSTGVVETGICMVTATFSDIIGYTQSNSTNIIYYKNN